MRCRLIRPLGMTLALAALLAGGNALAEGFGTPVIDGALDGAYGPSEADDPAIDEPQGNQNMDMVELYVVNDNTFWYFYFTVDDDLGVTDWGKYIINIDVTSGTLRSLTKTFLAPSLSRVPSHFGQGCTLRYLASSSRTVLDSVSR